MKKLILVLFLTQSVLSSAVFANVDFESLNNKNEFTLTGGFPTCYILPFRTVLEEIVGLAEHAEYNLCRGPIKINFINLTRPLNWCGATKVVMNVKCL